MEISFLKLSVYATHSRITRTTPRETGIVKYVKYRSNYIRYVRCPLKHRP